ncbi:hypothetical protein A3K86_20260 [Photobacterium jeanii]|uniref:Lipoprotein n=1 Tax=Photobacterium jeanii TaxID=858640 RepID=A0A178K3K6_9GAMM|nr:hypothetical protein [Photobacterium jeanii]OAN11292.1 hypothetical protein A3K86_20260 [Photobacterium jeanii]PST90812.1 hypothetical protein C9I91_09370 [Photobacterium jeanii]
MKVKFLAASIILSTLLAGCGGGSSSGSSGTDNGSGTKPPVKPQVKQGAFHLATGIADNKAAPILDGYTPFRFSLVNERSDISPTSPVRITIENDSSAIFRHYDLRFEQLGTKTNGHQFALQSYGDNTQQVDISLSYTPKATQRTETVKYQHTRNGKAHYFFAPTATDPDESKFGIQDSIFRLFVDKADWDKAGKVAVINRLTHSNVHSDELAACIGVTTNKSAPAFNTELVKVSNNTELSHFVKGALPSKTTSKQLLIGLEAEESVFPTTSQFGKADAATRKAFLDICQLQDTVIKRVVTLDLMPYHNQDTAMVLFNDNGKLAVSSSKLPLLTWRAEQQASQ